AGQSPLAARRVARKLERLSQFAGEVLDELPGDAAGAGAASGGPGERLDAQRILLDAQPEMRGIGLDHREIFVLAAIVEAEPQSEAIRQRDLLLHRFRRVDRGGALV